MQVLVSLGLLEGVPYLLEKCFNAILDAESAEQLGATRYERTNNRTDSRNGSRERTLVTRIGRLSLTVPRHRNQPFKTMLFDSYKRSEAALITTMAEMVLCGVSTRKVSNVMEKLCGTSYSKSTVSDVCKTFDKEVESFRNRDIAGNYPFMILDATYFKVRENDRIVSKAMMIAHATNSRGEREILHFGVYDRESNDTWLDFLTNLKSRGVDGVYMITSDAHEGIQNAIAKVFPTSAWQRCTFHFARNVAGKAPKKCQPALRFMLSEMFRQPDIEAAREKRNEIFKKFGDEAEKAMICLDEGFDSAMTYMCLPINMRRYYSTSNQVERLNEELKRRSNVIRIFPNEASLIRLMGAVLIEQNHVLQLTRSVFSEKTWKAFADSDAPEALAYIAEKQILVAAA